MSKFTERLVQIAAIMVFAWFGWQLAVNTVITIIQANNHAAQAEQHVNTLAQELATCHAPSKAPEVSK